MRRWPTGEEIAELYKRAKYLIDTQGEVTSGFTGGGKVQKAFRCNGLAVRLTEETLLFINDTVAGVMVADYETGAIREAFGSTAYNVLLKMRKMMVLDDVANA